MTTPLTRAEIERIKNVPLWALEWTEAERDALCAQALKAEYWKQASSNRDEMLQTRYDLLLKMEAYIVELREALEPFVRASEHLLPDEETFDEASIAPPVTIGNFRRACTALSGDGHERTTIHDRKT